MPASRTRPIPATPSKSCLALALCAVVAASCGDGGAAAGSDDNDVIALDTQGGDAVGDDDAPDDADAPDGADVAPDGGPLTPTGEPCTDDAACASGLCLRVAAADTLGFCTDYCFRPEDCPTGEWGCVLIAASGDLTRVCVPDGLCIDRDDDGYGYGAGCDGPDCDDDDADRNLAAQELCDGVDNDCDGFVDDDAVEVGRPCSTGFAGACAVGLGACVGGTAICEPSARPGNEICDGLDNDCDDNVDEGTDGAPLRETCYGGPAASLGVGQCVAGQRDCNDGTLGDCVGQVLPFPELCDGVDNDCDDTVDEGAIGNGVACDTGALGVCARGQRSCVDDGVCVQLAEPSDEVCDGLDNDCDGTVDEATGGGPLERTCYEGPPATIGVGLCVGGVQRCTAGEFGLCLDDVLPSIELCDAADNDCDGDVDEDAIGGGLSCDTGLDGVCAVGFGACEGSGGAACVPAFEPSDEVCDGLDNDCDGDIDEGADGEPLSRACYGGPEGTRDTGTCRGGRETCESGVYTACREQVVPAFELCDGDDNDCDGDIDEGNPGGGALCDTDADGACRQGLSACEDGALRCVQRVEAADERCDGVDNDCDGGVDEDGDGNPLSRACYDGPDGTLDRGTCRAGLQTCDGGEFRGCRGATVPTVEFCDGADNDCDDDIDEDAVNAASVCNTGLPGVCASGFATCDGGETSGCVPTVSAGPEVCDGLDNDCDGDIDEGTDDAPLSRACYTGGDGTLGVGLCSAGRESCIAGQFTACIEQLTPAFEACDDVDNDCDGDVDEGNPGGGALCDADALGVCRTGTSTCVDGALACVSRVAPADETCDGRDNDCDGDTDESDDGGLLARTCYSGPPGTEDVGACRAGVQTCAFASFGTCEDMVTPTIETCDGVDNDCDGDVDEDAVLSTSTCATGLDGTCALGVVACDDGGEVCTPVFPAREETCDGLDTDCDGDVDEDADGAPLSRACYTGPAGTLGTGDCRAGREVCTFGQFTACQGQTTPQFETCDDRDNDCNGDVDDGAAGAAVLCNTGEEGICSQGATACVGGAIACVRRFEPTDEVCDGADNDCDGDVDEGTDGAPLTRACYDGPDDTVGVGQCRGGTATCRFGDWGGCAGQIIPLSEICDLDDNDCDGDVDEGAQLPFFVDRDLDGFGDPDTIVMACFADGFVTNGLDCYDMNGQANPEQRGHFSADRGDGSFDYDCDDAETGFFSGFGSCLSTPPLCRLEVEGWDPSGAIPACGQTGTYIFDCLGNGANCDPTTDVTAQRCR